jgi:hypothetical protein
VQKQYTDCARFILNNEDFFIGLKTGSKNSRLLPVLCSKSEHV